MMANNYSNLSLKDLRKELSLKGCKVSGRKKELVERLVFSGIAAKVLL